MLKHNLLATWCGFATWSCLIFGFIAIAIFSYPQLNKLGSEWGFSALTVVSVFAGITGAYTSLAISKTIPLVISLAPTLVISLIWLLAFKARFDWSWMLWGMLAYAAVILFDKYRQLSSPAGDFH